MSVDALTAPLQHRRRLASTGASSSQGQQGDLAGREHPERRSPEPCSAARVQLCPIAVSTQTVHHRLVQSDQEIEGPDLAAVGVARDLKVDVRAHRVCNLLGLMRKEKDRQCAVGSRESGLQVRAVSVHSRRLRGRVVHPGDDQPVTAVLDDEVPVVQGGPADALHVVQPTLASLKYSWLPVT